MNEENYLISVVIPVYNGGKTIRRCLESVYKSTYASFECIVVDDNSNDSTVKIVESFNAILIKLDGHQGAAYARNKGAEAAKGDILLFIDADVVIYPDCMDKVVQEFIRSPGISAVFGSYEDKPASKNFCSQYKNLFHHYIHQTSREDASTFWTACGAVKKDVFFSVGKFNENCRMMEDVELGYRMKSENYKIHLNKELVVKHLKHYSFISLLKSDFFDRAVPWTVLILSNKQKKNDLNLKIHHRLSAFVVILLTMFVLLTILSIRFVWGIPLLLILFSILNQDFYKFYFKKRGVLFALKVVPFHILYYLYSTLGYLVGHYKYHLNKTTS